MIRPAPQYELCPPFCPLHNTNAPCLICLFQEVTDIIFSKQVEEEIEDKVVIIHRDGQDIGGILFQKEDHNVN